jgi:hypothetical protein
LNVRLWENIIWRKEVERLISAVNSQGEFTAGLFVHCDEFTELIKGNLITA